MTSFNFAATLLHTLSARKGHHDRCIGAGAENVRGDKSDQRHHNTTLNIREHKHHI